jgi:hypothetical protein
MFEHDDTYRDDIVAHKKHELFQTVDWFTTRQLRLMDYRWERPTVGSYHW